MNYGGDNTPLKVADMPIDVTGITPPLKHEFAAITFPLCAPLIGPIGTQQIVLVAGAPGVGKTQLGIAWGDCLSNGRDWLRWPVPQPRGVLLIDGEMPGALVQERLALYPPGPSFAPFKIMNAINWVAELGLPHPNLNS